MSSRHYRVIAPNFAAETMVEEVTAHGEPKASTCVYRGRRNTLFYIDPSSRLNPLPFAVNVKAFRVPPFPNGYAYRLVRPSKAQRSYRNAVKLIDMGFHTPRPVAFSEIHHGLAVGHKGAGVWPKMSRSYYFCEQLPYPNCRDWEARPDAPCLAAALGAEMARIHASGIWFKDFSPGNILLRETAEGGYEFFYVDLNRMEFGVTDRRKLMRMFRSISWSDEWITILAREYARAASMNPDTVVAEALAAANEYRHGHARKERLKHWIFTNIYNWQKRPQ